MKATVKFGQKEKRFIDRVSDLSGENIYSCYQCGRCSAGCPFAGEMDILPNQIIRLVQLGLEDDLLNCKAIYVCCSCFTCQSRCPKGIDMAHVAEAARHIIDPKGKDHFGPIEVPTELADELPQQVFVALFKKLSK
jgi:heterodisulfide reductase subunit C